MLNRDSNTAHIKYFATEQQKPFFFTEQLHKVVDHLARVAGDKTHIWVYPDAYVKSNGLPSGTVTFSSPQDALLFPFLLRDPGCGYLLFKLEFTAPVSADWHHAAGQLLEALVTTGISKIKQTLSLDLNKILHQGLHAFKDTVTSSNFTNINFPVTDSLTLTPNEIEQLYEDFMVLTNTVEIRSLVKSYDQQILATNKIDNNTLIGFIHSGSDLFPSILAKRFVYNIAEYADVNHIATLEDIKQGIFGVHLNSSLGIEYYQWLQAAMNYALCSRYQLFQAVKKTLETQFPCQITLLQDNVHAGIFEKTTADNQHIVYSTRGVQNLTPDLNLLAGQRETPAALVTAGSKAQLHHNFFAHGTSYQIRDDHEYVNYFNEQVANEFLYFSRNAFYNTQANENDCLPFTFNLLDSMNYFQQIGLAQPVALLAPLINIQSSCLKKQADFWK